MLVIRRLYMLCALVVLGCGTGEESTAPPPPPPPATQTWPVVYYLTALPSPYMPGSVFTDPANCNRVMQSSIEAGELTLHQNGTAVVSFRAWEEDYTSVNVPGIPCPSFFVRDLSKTLSGIFAVTGTGASRELTITLGPTVFARAPLGASGFPSSLAASIVGSSAFGLGNPYGHLQGATRWTLR